MRSYIVSLLTIIILIFVALTTAGCGSSDGLPRVAVSGSVTLNGKAAPHGVIRFMPAAGTEGPVASTMIANGQYDIPRDQGPVPGNYEVRVHAFEDPNADHIAYPKVRVEPVGGENTASKNPSVDVGGGENADSSAAPGDAKRTFNTTIPEMSSSSSSFEQDFAL
ncbi:MAG: hypothetical protein O3B13_11280 [Planctomycetota bacterium]|nr:hypothetical protein [Planctomycetota bacterium]